MTPQEFFGLLFIIGGIIIGILSLHSASHSRAYKISVDEFGMFLFCSIIIVIGIYMVSKW